MTRRALFRSLCVLPVAVIFTPAQKSLLPVVDSASTTTVMWVGVDETHAMKDRSVLDVIETATGARRGSLSFVYSPSSCLPPTLSDLDRRICKLVTTKIF